jgi:orotidine-5'-phosphate decarboxylase
MKKAKEYIIFPLDVSSFTEAKRLINMLFPYVGVFKVGLELFIKCGHQIVNLINEKKNCKIFLDLKLHDIPETVFRAMKAIAELNVFFATVHCGESKKMLKTAVDGCREKVNVLGVTVLTSISSSDIINAGFKKEFCDDMQRLVLKRALIIKEAGCKGIVCSGLEIEAVRKSMGNNFIIVTPGIRPLWENLQKDDQKRVTTPAQAVLSGADYIVVGRPIRNADNPIDAAVKIASEIEAAKK